MGSVRAARSLRSSSELLGFPVVLSVVVDVGERAHHVGGVEDRRGGLQARAHRGELHLDLVDGLLTEVADVEEVSLGPGDELADRVDALALQAVVRPYGQVQLLDRQSQIGRELSVLWGRSNV